MYTLTPEEAAEAERFALLNAAHDVICTGCPWCRWTGQASFLALTTGTGDPA